MPNTLTEKILNFSRIRR